MKNTILFHRLLKRTLLVMSCLLLLSGCWNSRELDELGVAVMLGIDKDEDGDYILTVQVINPSEIATDAPTTRPPISTYSTKGGTLVEALRKLTTKTPRAIYFSQLRLVVLGSNIAEEGVMPALDFLYRDHEFRTSFYIIVAKNAPPESVLSIITPYEKIPANKIMNSIDNVEKHWGATKGASIDEIISSIRSEGEDPVMSGIILIGEKDIGNHIVNVENVDAPTKLQIDDSAIFKGDQLIGWLGEKDSQGLNYATGNVQSTVITHPCEDEGSLSIEILRTNASQSSKIKNGKPSISIDIEAEGNISEVDCKVDLSKPESIDKINKESEKAIKERVQSVVKLAQEEFESDIFGFGNVVHRDNPGYWKKVKKEWPEQFKDLDVNINVKMQIRRKGNSTQPIDKKG